MALGGNVLRQHVVEFIRGTGVVTDGVVDATSTNGPWSWTVPEGVAELKASVTGAGNSGGAGAFQAAALSAGGGAGGKSGQAAIDVPLFVVPGRTLTVTLGAGGVGTASSDGAFGTGGNTTVAGLLPGLRVVNGTLTAICAEGSWQGSSPTSALTAVATRGQGQGSDGADGSNNQATMFIDAATSVYSGVDTGASFAATGGGGKASGAAGGNGGTTPQTYRAYVSFVNSSALNWATVSTGTASGGGSWGGGGRGSPSLFSGRSPAGGNGDVAGASAAAGDYGAGGGGGGGSGTARRAGGNGGDGYVRFTYWSMD